VNEVSRKVESTGGVLPRLQALAPCPSWVSSVVKLGFCRLSLSRCSEATGSYLRATVPTAPQEMNFVFESASCARFACRIRSLFKHPLIPPPLPAKPADTLGPERYTEVQRSQHVTQADPRVFGASYDKLFLDGGHSSVSWRGNGTESLTESLKRDPGFLELELEVQSLEKMEVDQATLDKAKRKLSCYHSSQHQKALVAYQEEWVQRRRELKILSRGELPVTDGDRLDEHHPLHPTDQFDAPFHP
jgi:hypothetical protein